MFIEHLTQEEITQIQEMENSTGQITYIFQQ